MSSDDTLRDAAADFRHDTKHASWDGDTYDQYDELHGAMRAFVYALRPQRIIEEGDRSGYVKAQWDELGVAVGAFCHYLDTGET